MRDAGAWGVGELEVRMGSVSSKIREVEVGFIGSKEVLVCWLGLIDGLNLRCWIRRERVNDR